MRVLLAAGAAMLALTGCGGQAGNESAAAPSGTSAPVIPAPNGGDWAQVVSETPDGGFVMGNPDAPVKLIEFASFTCPHCADFAENGVPPLVERYVKTGQVSFELRNFVRDPVDLAAALLSRCGGATPYFKLTDQIFAAQEEWFSRLQTMPQDEQQRLQSLPPNQVTGVLAERAGLVQFARVRGIPEDRARACLSDQAAIDRLVAANQAATQQYNLTGTPSFVINGRVVENAADWGSLEPRIRDAIG